MHITSHLIATTLLATVLAPTLWAAGSWEAHPAYTDYVQAVLLGDKIYVRSATGNLFLYDPTDGTTQTLSRLDGLSGNLAATLVGDAGGTRLVIIYTDGDIDVLHTNGNHTNLPDLKNKSLADKTINSAHIVGQRLYIAAGYGFSVVDLGSETFAESYLFNENCLEAFEQDGTLYMVTNSGLYACPTTANAYDRTQWQALTAGSVTTPADPSTNAGLLASVTVAGPASSNLHALAYGGGYLRGIAGTPNIWGGIDLTDGVIAAYSDDEKSWNNLTLNNIKNYPVVDQYSGQGLASIAIHPTQPERYAVGTLYDGLLLMEGDSVVAHYNAENSPLTKFWKERVTALTYDDDGTLWMGNPNEGSGTLRALLPDGSWMSYPITGFDGGEHLYVNDVLVAQHDDYRFKWICKTDKGVAIYYDAGTPADLTDDQSCYFASLTDQDGNGITPNYYNGFCEDNDGAVWILTSSGPFVADSPLETFNSQGTVRRIKIPRNDGTNLADYLLANVDTRCMVVDAANRKWVGTASSGLYLLSADGLTTLEHFTTDNSPLYSDYIQALAIDRESGHVFISTQGGLLTYKSDAVGGQADFSTVYCYPNPVRPEYTGDLCITGLMDATQVRITDVHNNVVFAATSAGGSVRWDLCNRSGRRVKAGVYLIYGVDEAGKKGCVSKLLVVR
jgi:hypothetical protein